jgi:putative lipase involved disintegration of autophagic bodies
MADAFHEAVAGKRHREKASNTWLTGHSLGGGLAGAMD